MPSSFSPDLRLEIIANGEQSGTWGTTTNTNIGTLIEDAITGWVTVSVISSAQALTAASGASDEARCAMLRLTTTTGASFEVYAPPVPKTYVIFNDSGQQATLFCSSVIGNTTPAGGPLSGFVIPTGTTVFVRSNGTQFYQAIDYVSGNFEVSNNLIVGSNIVLASPLGETSGGTGTGTYTTGDILYSDATNSLAKLPIGVANRVLRSNGTTPSWSQVALGTDVSGTLPVANGGIGTSTAGITAFNNITGYTAAGATGTTSTNLVFSTSPSLTTPAFSAPTFSTSDTVTATGVTLTSDYNVITTAGAGATVVLPVPTTGRKVIVVNRGANPVTVGPGAGVTIDGAASVTLPVNGVIEFNAASTTLWYSSINSTTSASSLTGVVGVTNGGTGLNTIPAFSIPVANTLNTLTTLTVGANQSVKLNSTGTAWEVYTPTTGTGSVSFAGTVPAAAGQVTVYGDTTGNSISTTRTYQFRASSVGQAQIQLFEDTDNGTDSITIQPPASVGTSYTLTLPTGLPAASGYYLASTTTGTLSWTPPPSSGVTSLAGAGAISVDTPTGAVTVSVATANGTSTAGIVSTTSQTFGGAKTFSSPTRLATGSSVNAASISNWGLYILSDTSDPGLAVFNRGATSLGGYAGAFIYDPTRGANPIVFQQGSSVGSATTTGSISGSGSNVAYNTSSDYRLKENIVPLTDAITKLKLLAPKRFTWKAVPEEGVVEGFIAHEVQEVVPTAVTGVKDAVDANGNIIPQGIDSSFLIPLLTAALQEAVARIEALETRLANQ